MTIQRQTAGDEATPLALEDFIIFFSRHWLKILACASVSIALGIAYAVFATPIYRSEAKLLATADPLGAPDVGASLGGLAALAGIQAGGASREHEYLALLRSRSLLEQYLFANDIPQSLYPDRSVEGVVGQGDPDQEVVTKNEVIDRFLDNALFVSRDQETGIVTLAIEWSDPAEARKWAQGLIETVNAQIRQRDLDSSQKSIQFLTSEIEKTSVVGGRQVLYQLLEKEYQKTVLANVQVEYAFRVVDPPTQPDLDDIRRPKRALVVGASAILGLFLGLGLAVISAAIQRARAIVEVRQD